MPCSRHFQQITHLYELSLGFISLNNTEEHMSSLEFVLVCQYTTINDLLTGIFTEKTSTTIVILKIR